MLSREILEKLTNKQLIDAYIGLKYKYETLEAKYDLLISSKISGRRPSLLIKDDIDD